MALSECESDDCIFQAHENYAACLQACGILVPPIPDPDPCVNECERSFERNIYDGIQGANFKDHECLAEAERVYVHCLEECRVDIPEPFAEPGDDPTPDGLGCIGL